jgi:carboxyl-terminal processing protease
MLRWKQSLTLKLVFLVILVFLLGLSLGIVKTYNVGAGTDVYENLKVFTDVLSIVQRDYVENTQNGDLVYGAIKGMLATLDPHSSFMPPEVFKETQEETKGVFEGLGIEIEMKDGILTVVAPIEDTPAWKAGIKAKDQILKINGESTKQMTLPETVNKLRGPRGSTVTVSIMREGFEKPKDFVITRSLISVASVRSDVPENGYGYIRIRQFSERTDQEFQKAIKEVEESSKGSLKGLVLDLRDNPGGLLDQAVKIADQFIDSGVIVAIKGRIPSSKATYMAHSGTKRNYPVIVLVSTGSASGSEIVAGALQDHHRAVILGTQTFGKASVQTLYPLRDGSGLRLTTGRYYTPSGRDIQAEGIMPDIVLPPFNKEEDKEQKTGKQSQPQYPLEKDLERHLKPVEQGPGNQKADAKMKPMNPELEKFLNGLKAKVKDKEVDGQKIVALEILKNWKTFQSYYQKDGGTS